MISLLNQINIINQRIKIINELIILIKEDKYRVCLDFNMEEINNMEYDKVGILYGIRDNNLKIIYVNSYIVSDRENFSKNITNEYKNKGNVFVGIVFKRYVENSHIINMFNNIADKIDNVFRNPTLFIIIDNNEQKLFICNGVTVNEATIITKNNQKSTDELVYFNEILDTIKPYFVIYYKKHVLDEIKLKIGNVNPEQGGALFGTINFETKKIYVNNFIHDYNGYTTSIGYRPSRGFNDIINSTQTNDSYFLGIIHSHPHTLIHPSRGDYDTMAELFAQNNHYKLILVPIITHNNVTNSQYEINISDIKTAKINSYIKQRGVEKYIIVKTEIY